MKSKISFPGFALGEGEPLVFIAGPCVLESREHALRHAGALKEICDKLNVPLIFKASFDKANRTSKDSYRGLGLDAGLEIMAEVKRSLDLPLISDIHLPEQAAVAAEVLDVLQVPAFLCRQTDILEAVGATKCAALIKKGQFLAPEDMIYAAEKVQSGGGEDIMLCERGSCFGYRNLVVDMRALPIMKDFGLPVVFDATHSVQVMGGAGGKSGGARRFVIPLARAAVAVGVDAVFLECHEDPGSAPSDGPNMLPLGELETVFKGLKELSEV